MADEPTIRQYLLGGGGFASLGAGAAWLWGQIRQYRKSRAARLEEREEKYVAKLEARLDALEKTVKHQDALINAHGRALTILIAKEERIDPGSLELRMVRDILGDAYPVRPETPRDMRDMLDKI